MEDAEDPLAELSAGIEDSMEAAGESGGDSWPLSLSSLSAGASSSAATGEMGVPGGDSWPLSLLVAGACGDMELSAAEAGGESSPGSVFA